MRRLNAISTDIQMLFKSSLLVPLTRPSNTGRTGERKKGETRPVILDSLRLRLLAILRDTQT
jgi:hypothetical protein